MIFTSGFEAAVIWLFTYGLQILTVARVLTREQREPSSRIAWILCIMAVPVIGMLIYFLFGETSFGRKSVARMDAINDKLPKSIPNRAARCDLEQLPLNLRQSFARARSVNGFDISGGNTGSLLDGTDATVDALVDDIDQAKDHVHLMFYIWLSDANGLKVAQAVSRAAKRGVACRCLIDGVGSREFSKSLHWFAMKDAGVQTAIAFSLRYLPVHLFFGRVDIRNHRKLVVIDNRIGYCGSQNCADSDFAPKRRYSPWIDVMVRLVGPIVWEQQHIFVSDWTTHAGEDIAGYLAKSPQMDAKGFPAVAIGTGPTANFNSIPDIFQNLLNSAQHEVLIATPYFVPSESLLQRVCAAALRGISVQLILPRNNDSRIVAYASRSYYLPMLQSGVELYEYSPGLLHSKYLVVDGQAVFWGSANLDRRSFDINFENCILAYDEDLSAQFMSRQRRYLAKSERITLDAVERWSIHTRIRNNLIATMGPLL